LLILIVFIPFQALIIELLDQQSGLSASVIFWIGHWYEPAILILLVLSIIFCLDQIKKALVYRAVQVVWLLVAVGVMSVLLDSPSINQGLEGFRFALLPLVVFLLAVLYKYDITEKQKLIRNFLVVSVVAAAWALLERFFPLRYLELWGIVPVNSVFGYGNHKIVSIYQSASFLGGPNQLASYLIPAFLIILLKVVNKPKLGWLIVVLIVIFLAITFAFSRSAVVGLMVAVLLYAVHGAKNTIAKTVPLAIIGAAILLSVVTFKVGGQYLGDLFTHGRSQQEHLTAYQLSWSELKSRVKDPETLVFGSGLGTAGPITLKYQDGLVSESWYIQLLLEVGIIGLVLWLSVIYLLTVDQFRRPLENTALGYGLIAISITALFLHTWADNPALSISLFVLLGTICSDEKTSKTLSVEK
jgi:O-antigen ligase